MKYGRNFPWKAWLPENVEQLVTNKSQDIAYKCTGSPADCIKIGLYKILHRRPDIILSGINHGSNSSINQLYSGTMGAALEGDIPNNGVMHANFAVTRNPEVPSCLVETDFIATPEGEEAIWNYKRRRKIAESIAAGIDDWRLTK